MSSCKVCNREKKTPKSPGWRKHGEDHYCSKCWKTAFRAIAITLPVMGILEGDKKELWERMGDAWKWTTQLANWLSTELISKDIRRTPEMEKLPPQPKTYLYPEARKIFPAIPSVVVTTIDQDIQNGYKENRYEILWRREKRPPGFNYPYPYKAPSQAITVYRHQLPTGANHFVVSVPLPCGRTSFVLRTGYQFHRQEKHLHGVLKGEVKYGAVSIRRQSCFTDENGTDRTNGGGNKRRYRIMLSLVVWIPRSIDTTRENKLSVCHGGDAFLVATHPKREQPWILKSNQVRGWVKRHEKLLQGIADDTKAETRRPKREKLGLLDRYETLKRLHKNRMKSYCQQAAAWLVAYAVRGHCSEILYDDSRHDYLPEFPWHQLKVCIQHACDGQGILFTEVKKEVGNQQAQEEN